MVFVISSLRTILRACAPIDLRGSSREMGNCISRRHSPMPESGEQPYSVDEAIASGSPFENVAGSASNVMPGPDLVAVKLRCSCNLGCIEEEHLKALLKSLHDVSCTACRFVLISPCVQTPRPGFFHYWAHQALTSYSTFMHVSTSIY